MAKTKVVQPIKAIGLAKQALPDGTAKQQRALADQILELNNQKRGAAFDSGENVKLGKGVSISTPSSTPLDNVRLYSPANMDPGGAFVPSSPVVASVPAVPAVPQPVPVTEDKSIKSASPDIILVDQNDLPIDLILKLTLEKIGAQELISLVRHDTVNGQNIVYQPVKNISDIAISYNPQNIINIPDTAEIYFKNFAIKMENHIVQDTNETPPESVYIDSVNGNIVIETVNLKADYEIEVQMMASGQIFNDTIYEEDVS
jgi:hypothetical protein